LINHCSTRHADTFELKPDEPGKRYLRDRIKADGTILIVAVPEDDEVAATDFGAPAQPEENGLRLADRFRRRQVRRRESTNPDSPGG
jgi:hypothetical protein